VPEPGNPQALNRYSYTYNNPIRYIDPSGHAVEGNPVDIEIELPSWARSGIVRRALDVTCFFLSCHIDDEQGVLRGPTPEEMANQAMVPPGMTITGSGLLLSQVSDEALGIVEGRMGQEVIELVERKGINAAKRELIRRMEAGGVRFFNDPETVRYLRSIPAEAGVGVDEAGNTVISSTVVFWRVVSELSGYYDHPLLGE
jgi:hypothetical protein